MVYITKIMMLWQLVLVHMFLRVSADDANSTTMLQESLNIISSELKSMKTKYEENQVILLSIVNDLQYTVQETKSRFDVLQQQFTEHKQEVAQQLEDVKRVMVEDHTMLKANSMNLFNKMVDVLVETRIQHRLQKDIQDEVENMSKHLESLQTNKQCIGTIDEEEPCPGCSIERISGKTRTEIPQPTEPNNILPDVETLAPPPPVTHAPDPPALPLAPPRVPPFAPPSPRNLPPIEFPTQRPEPRLTTAEKTETKVVDCNSPFFRLESTGECMVVSVSKRTWMDSQASCLKIGANLAVPEDPRELHAYMRKAGARSYYYVGAHNKLGEFRWLNGTLFDRRYWRPQSPSTSYPRRLCVAYSYNGSGNKLFWANKATVCDTGLRYNFICEKS